MLVPGYESFVGLYPIPMRHGMTIGELAQLFNDAVRHRRGARSRSRWRAGARDMYFDETGLPWVMPSPNMPTLDTAIVYPGTRPLRRHERVGRPRHDAAVRARRRTVDRRRALRRRHEPRAACPACASGRRSSSRRSRSTRGRRAAAASSTSPIVTAFRSVETGDGIDRAFRAAIPTRFSWRDRPTSTRHEKMPIDILAGSPRCVSRSRAGSPPARLRGRGNRRWRRSLERANAI